jgi:hypothetical protein
MFLSILEAQLLPRNLQIKHSKSYTFQQLKNIWHVAGNSKNTIKKNTQNIKMRNSLIELT